MGTIVRLPAGDCRHFASGRCLGLGAGLRCRALGALEDAYDAMLDRAEAFELQPRDEPAVLRHMARRLERLAEASCPDRNGAGPQDCTLLRGDLCLLTLPPCPGRCPNFVSGDAS